MLLHFIFVVKEEDLEKKKMNLNMSKKWLNFTKYGLMKILE